MTERVCGNCRWWSQIEPTLQNGQCRRYPPIWFTQGYLRPSMHDNNFCGEWADKAIASEQEEKREMVRQFAVALLTRHGDSLAPHDAWDLAIRMADAEPGNSGREI